MGDWKQKIMDAFNSGKTIQSWHDDYHGFDGEWIDFKRQNQLDKPNLDVGDETTWRIKKHYAKGKDGKAVEVRFKSNALHEADELVKKIDLNQITKETKITRFEYITETREIVEYGEFEISIQDEGRTVKIFKK